MSTPTMLRYFLNDKFKQISNGNSEKSNELLLAYRGECL